MHEVFVDPSPLMSRVAVEAVCATISAAAVGEPLSLDLISCLF